MAEQENLSEERQLDPTERRIQKAREQGQFPQSRDLTTLMVISAFTLALWFGGQPLSAALIKLVATGLELPKFHQDWGSTLQAWVSGPLAECLLWLLVILLPVWLVSMVAPLALVKLQPVWAFRFNASLLNPLTGMGRMFSWQTVNEALKSLLKVFFLFGLGFAYLMSHFESLHILAQQDLMHSLSIAWSIMRKGFTWLLIPLVVIAAVDVALRWFGFKKRMRMSQEELKQELKETEGSPEQRSRLRQRQRQIATARMMSALEKADVVLANPDHYAVALKYDGEKMFAPVVVAKGLDELALRMQAVAKEKSIPVARIPPLARLMHHRLKVGEAVPPMLFEAVAKVIAWAYDAKGKAEWDQGPLPDVGPLPDSESI
jgi:flagellar biosynthetic protein FlhB